MMRKKIALIFLITSLNVSSQSFFNIYEKGEIFFRDGTQAEGLIKIVGFFKNEIKFKKTKEDKKQLYTYKKVKKIRFTHGDEYLYKIDAKRRRTLLIKREINGEIDLFSIQGQSPGFQGGGAGFGSGGVSIGFGFGGGSYAIYYIGKDDTDFIDLLPKNTRKKKFWVTISKHTSGCKEFSDKIKNKNTIKKNFKDKRTAVVDMVNFYNENCN
jgi:hypothetical protein